MKKSIACVLTICLVAVSLAFSVSAAVTNYGDANGDEIVNVKDLVHMKKNGDTSINMIAVDADEDNTIDDDDFALLRKVLVGAESYVTVMEGNINWSDSWD